MIENVLQNLGLTQNEIKVYLALISLGESKSGEILKKSGLNSGKIYEILNSLQKKGFVSQISKGGVKYFSPADPKRVLDYLKEKRENLENQEKDYKDILPRLIKQISNKSQKTKVEVFFGLKGLKTAWKKELEFPKSEPSYILGVGSQAKYSKDIWDYFVEVHRYNRERKGHIVKKLLSEDARGEKSLHEKNAQIKYLPYGSMVAMGMRGNFTWIDLYAEEIITIMIESRDITNHFKKQFEFLWKISKP